MTLDGVSWLAPKPARNEALSGPARPGARMARIESGRAKSITDLAEEEAGASPAGRVA
jgi:hypothetical protein